MTDTPGSRRVGLARGYANRAYRLLLFATGVLLLAGGLWLVALRGSLYYALAGLALALCAWLRSRQPARAVQVISPGNYSRPWLAST